MPHLSEIWFYNMCWHYSSETVSIKQVRLKLKSRSISLDVIRKFSSLLQRKLLALNGFRGAMRSATFRWTSSHLNFRFQPSEDLQALPSLLKAFKSQSISFSWVSSHAYIDGNDFCFFLLFAQKLAQPWNVKPQQRRLKIFRKSRWLIRLKYRSRHFNDVFTCASAVFRFTAFQIFAVGVMNELVVARNKINDQSRLILHVAPCWMVSFQDSQTWLITFGVSRSSPLTFSVEVLKFISFLPLTQPLVNSLSKIVSLDSFWIGNVLEWKQTVLFRNFSANENIHFKALLAVFGLVFIWNITVCFK